MVYIYRFETMVFVGDRATREALRIDGIIQHTKLRHKSYEAVRTIWRAIEIDSATSHEHLPRLIKMLKFVAKDLFMTLVMYSLTIFFTKLSWIITKYNGKDQIYYFNEIK